MEEREDEVGRVAEVARGVGVEMVGVKEDAMGEERVVDSGSLT